MSLGLVVLIAGVIFALVVAALPLWDIRHQLWATWDWRDWTRVALATLALLLPVAVFMIALPCVPWFEAIIPKSLVPAEWGGLRSQRRHMEALSKQGLAVVEPASGVDHSDVSIPLSNLAELYCDQGRYLEAEALYERVLAIREGVLGPYHPSVSVVLTRVADLYRAQGRYTEAEPLYRRALTIYQTAFGPDHPSLPPRSIISRYCFSLKDGLRKPSRCSNALSQVEDRPVPPTPRSGWTKPLGGSVSSARTVCGS